MTQRYVAPIQIVSAKPEYPRYSVQEDRRDPIFKSASGKRPAPPSNDQSPRRDHWALALLVLVAALAIFVALALFL